MQHHRLAPFVALLQRASNCFLLINKRTKRKTESLRATQLAGQWIRIINWSFWVKGGGKWKAWAKFGGRGGLYHVRNASMWVGLRDNWEGVDGSWAWVHWALSSLSTANRRATHKGRPTTCPTLKPPPPPPRCVRERARRRVPAHRKRRACLPTLEGAQNSRGREEGGSVLVWHTCGSMPPSLLCCKKQCSTCIHTQARGTFKRTVLCLRKLNNKRRAARKMNLRGRRHVAEVFEEKENKQTIWKTIEKTSERTQKRHCTHQTPHYNNLSHQNLVQERKGNQRRNGLAQ